MFPNMRRYGPDNYRLHRDGVRAAKAVAQTGYRPGRMAALALGRKVWPWGPVPRSSVNPSVAAGGRG